MHPYPCALSVCDASAGANLVAVACSSLTGDEWRGRIALLDAGSLRERASLPTASGVCDVVWLPGGSDRLLSAYDDGGVYLSRVAVRTLPSIGGHVVGSVSCVNSGSSGISGDNHDAAAASGSGSAMSTTEASFLDHDDTVTGIALTSSAGTHFVSASWDCTARYWDASRADECVRVLRGHTAPVLAVCAMTFESACFATADQDGIVAVWDARSPATLTPVVLMHTGCSSLSSGAGASVKSLAATALCCAAEHTLLTGSVDGRLSCFDTRRPAHALLHCAPHMDAIRSIVARPSGGEWCVATASDDHTVQVSRLGTTAHNNEWSSPPLGDCVRACAWSGVSGLLVAAWPHHVQRYAIGDQEQQ